MNLISFQVDLQHTLEKVFHSFHMPRSLMLLKIKTKTLNFEA